MMKRLLAAALAGWLGFGSALAADNAVVLTPGTGVTMRTKDIGSGVQSSVVLQGDTSGNPFVADPCQTTARVYTPISIVTATTTRLVAPTSAKKTYVCGMFLQAGGGANNVGIVEGTGGTCGTGAAGVIGGATAAAGVLLAANQGFSIPVTGYAQAATAGTNVDFCLITSAAVQLSGVLISVQAP